MNDPIQWPCGTRKGYMEAHEGDGLVMDRLHVARGTVQPQTAPTLTTLRGGGAGVVVREGPSVQAVADELGPVDDGLRIRYLTPRECFRLMDQPDDAIDRIMEAVPAKTNQYKLAGNSIVVSVLADIFEGIYITKTFGKCEKRPKLEDYL